MEGGRGSDQRWDPNVRRKLRQELRDELVETHLHRDEITIPDELQKKLEKGNSLYQKVVSSREAVLDSEHFRLLSEIACHQSQAARGELIKFDPIKYREKLITFMGGRSTVSSSVESLEWYTLGERAIRAFRSSPCVGFCYGALETVPLRHIVRRSQATRSKHGTMSIEKPKELKGLEEEEESTTKDVKHILYYLKRVCKEEGGMEYHRFLVDPNSFSRTVENIFHFSFLIKEARAGIRRGEDGNPFVFIPESVDAAGQTTKTSKNQLIVSVNMRLWQEWIEKYDIQESYIPQRELGN